MAFEALEDTLSQAFRRGPIRATVQALRVEEVAKRLLPGWAEMVSFREGRLILAAPSPGHTQELFLQSDELKKKINAELGGKIVEEIRFRATS